MDSWKLSTPSFLAMLTLSRFAIASDSCPPLIEYEHSDKPGNFDLGGKGHAHRH